MSSGGVCSSVDTSSVAAPNSSMLLLRHQRSTVAPSPLVDSSCKILPAKPAFVRRCLKKNGCKKRWFTADEKTLLRQLVLDNESVILSRKNDGVSVHLKKEVWLSIADQFNDHPQTVTNRNSVELRRCWENMKFKAKKTLHKVRQQLEAAGTSTGLATLRFTENEEALNLIADSRQAAIQNCAISHDQQTCLMDQEMECAIEDISTGGSAAQNADLSMNARLTHGQEAEQVASQPSLMNNTNNSTQLYSSPNIENGFNFPNTLKSESNSSNVTNLPSPEIFLLNSTRNSSIAEANDSANSKASTELTNHSPTRSVSCILPNNDDNYTTSVEVSDCLVMTPSTPPQSVAFSCTVAESNALSLHPVSSSAAAGVHFFKNNVNFSPLSNPIAYPLLTNSNIGKCLSSAIKLPHNADSSHSILESSSPPFPNVVASPEEDGDHQLPDSVASDEQQQPQEEEIPQEKDREQNPVLQAPKLLQLLRPELQNTIAAFFNVIEGQQDVTSNTNNNNIFTLDDSFANNNTIINNNNVMNQLQLNTKLELPTDLSAGGRCHDLDACLDLSKKTTAADQTSSTTPAPPEPVTDHDSSKPHLRFPSPPVINPPGFSPSVFLMPAKFDTLPFSAEVTESRSFSLPPAPLSQFSPGSIMGNLPVMMCSNLLPGLNNGLSFSALTQPNFSVSRQNLLAEHIPSVSDHINNFDFDLASSCKTTTSTSATTTTSATSGPAASASIVDVLTSSGKQNYPIADFMPNQHKGHSNNNPGPDITFATSSTALDIDSVITKLLDSSNDRHRDEGTAPALHQQHTEANAVSRLYEENSLLQHKLRLLKEQREQSAAELKQRLQLLQEEHQERLNLITQEITMKRMLCQLQIEYALKSTKQ